MVHHLTPSYKPKNCSWCSSSHGLTKPITAHPRVMLELGQEKLHTQVILSSTNHNIYLKHYPEMIWKTFHAHLHCSCTMHIKCPFPTLTSLRWITIISYHPARLGFQNHSPFLVSTKGPLESRVSLSDVCRMLTLLSHVLLFTRSTRGRTQQPILQHPKENEAVREREVHKEIYCLDQGQDPLSTGWERVEDGNEEGVKKERERAWKQSWALLKNWVAIRLTIKLWSSYSWWQQYMNWNTASKSTYS